MPSSSPGGRVRTAGAKEKREFLRSLEILHVMDSRLLDFADEVLEATDGRGVDLVLNSPCRGKPSTKAYPFSETTVDSSKLENETSRKTALWGFGRTDWECGLSVRRVLHGDGSRSRHTRTSRPLLGPLSRSGGILRLGGTPCASASRVSDHERGKCFSPRGAGEARRARSFCRFRIAEPPSFPRCRRK